MSSLSPTSLTVGSSGSATGNPRNKCALKPGHSLMDWIRLGNSGVDLTGLKGRTKSVTAEELAKHNKRDDAWICIRGKVYNITRYMDFHPGGVDELMRGVGRDATKLFDEVHAWVNYNQLLLKCYIGPLQNVVKVEQNLLLALTSKTKSNVVKPIEPSDIVPRFDWTQKRNVLTFYFYTRQDCNPGILIQHKNSRELQIHIQIGHIAHKYDFELNNEVHWPLQFVNVNSTTGKIELAFHKTEENLWITYGTHISQRVLTWTVEAETKEFEYDFKVVSKNKFNHDSFELCLRNSDVIIVPPVGFHVILNAVINGEITKRSYTPVPAKYIINYDCTEFSNCLTFIIKSYGNKGFLSTHLEKLPLDATIQIGVPRGNFQLKTLQQCRRLVLLAGGSGLTPCLSLLEYSLKPATTKIEQILLIYFNKNESDIWCYDNLQKIMKTNEKFKFVSVLSQPSSEWTGLKGHISKELLVELLDKSIPESDTFTAICGPTIFNDLAENILKQLRYSSENIHVFRG